MFDAGEFLVHPVYFALDQRLHFGRSGQAGIVTKGHILVLGVFLDVFLIDHDDDRQVGPLIADDHRVGDVRRELQVVFQLRRRDIFATGGNDDVLHPVGDTEITLGINQSDIAGM